MITNPEYGWCNFKLGNFEGTPGYLTNIPVDLLEGFIEYFTKGVSSIWFDEEGAEFTLVLTPYNTYIIEDDEDSTLWAYPKINTKDLAREVILDIEKDFNSWVNWELFSNDEKRFKEQENKIKLLIEKLRELI